MRPLIGRALGRAPKPRSRYPLSPAEMRAACGGRGVWASGWLGRAAWGTALADAFGGGVPLSALNTPRWRDPGAYPGDLAVGFDSGSSDSFQAASSTSYDLGASTSIAMYARVRFSSLLNRNFMGKQGPVARNWACQLQSGPVGQIIGYIEDTPQTVAATVTQDHWQGGAGNWHDILWCLDRVNQFLQVFTDLGQSTAMDVSAIGTLTNAVPFYLGAGTSSTTLDAQIAFAALATGEVDVLRLNGAAVITAFRALTGLV